MFYVILNTRKTAVILLNCQNTLIVYVRSSTYGFTLYVQVEHAILRHLYYSCVVAKLKYPEKKVVYCLQFIYGGGLQNEIESCCLLPQGVRLDSRCRLNGMHTDCDYVFAPASEIGMAQEVCTTLLHTCMFI